MYYKVFSYFVYFKLFTEHYNLRKPDNWLIISKVQLKSVEAFVGEDY